MIDFQKKLDKQKAAQLYRSLVEDSEHLIDFYSNDYLGYARMMRAGQLLTPIQPEGATGSSLISGYTTAHRQAEEAVAAYFGCEGVTFYPSGYQANIGVVSAIAGRDQVILYDQYVHASIQDGMRLSLANRSKFKHNDMDHLENLLIQHKQSSIVVIVESLYSMTGQYVPIDELMRLKYEYGFTLIVDEAHAVGVAGLDQKGLVSGHWDDVIKIITFGKAFGFSGAAVLSNQLIKTFLVNFSRPFIYSTALPVSHMVTIRQIIEHASHEALQAHQSLQVVINQYLDKVNKTLTPFTFTRNDGPIQFVHIEDYTHLLAINSMMATRGLAVKAIRPPTVPEGSAGFRICLHAFNSESDLNKLFDVATWQL